MARIWVMMPSGAVVQLTPGSVPFGGSGGTLTEDNANFYWDNLNDRLGLGLNTPQKRLHINAGTGNTNGIQLTAGASTGTTSTDGTIITVGPTGLLEINNQENAGTIFYNNGLETMRFRSDNKVVIGFDFIGFSDLAVGINRDLGGGAAAAAVGILPTVTDTGGGSSYYGVAIQPTASGTDNSALVVGAFFSVSNNQSGTGGQLNGALINAQYTGGGGGGTIGEVRGITVTVGADSGSVTSDIFGVQILEPAYDEPAKVQALTVDGTWGVEEDVDSSSTGAIDAYEIFTSNLYFTNAGGVTLNGLAGGRTGKRVLIQFGSGATITHNSGAAAAGDKIFVSTGANITILGRGCVEVVWSGTDNGWNVISSQL